MISTLPTRFLRSLAWGLNYEIVQQFELRIDTGVVRQYFHRGTYLIRHRAEDLEVVANTLSVNRLNSSATSPGEPWCLAN